MWTRMLGGFTPKALACSMLLACSGSLVSSPAMARDLTGSSQLSVFDGDSITASGDLVLTHDGRELHAAGAAAAVAVKALAFLGKILVGEVIKIGLGEIKDGLFGKKKVPLDLTEQFEEALEEVDRIVGDRLAQAFESKYRSELDSLTRRIREYSRGQHLRDSRALVQDMLADASDLVSFFESNGVVSNGAYQVTVALRLGLLLEKLQLDILLEEGEARIEAGKANLKAQAKEAREVLEEWAATFRPVSDSPAVWRTFHDKNRKGILNVCMSVSSPGLTQPPAYCLTSECRERGLTKKRRKKKVNRCLDGREPGLRTAVKTHTDNVGIHQWRALNENAVFGDDFQDFLELLEDVEDMDFSGVELP